MFIIYNYYGNFLKFYLFVEVNIYTIGILISYESYWRMNSVSVDSCDGSCNNDESYISSRLPDKNVLIKGKNFEFAVGRLISQGRFGAVYEVNVKLQLLIS